MKKRIMCALLATMLTATCCVGCSSDTSKDSTTSADLSNSTTEQKNEEKTQSQSEVTSGEITIFQNAGKVQAAGKPGSSESDFNAVQTYIQEQTGIKVNVIIPPKGEEITKMNMMMAAKEEFDLFWDGWTKYADKKAIVPLTEQIEKYGKAIVENWGEEAMNLMKDKDGTIWGVPRMAPIVTYPVYVREDWLKTVGLSAPKTIQELEEVLKAFKEKDPAGNGSTIPMITTKGEDLHRTFAAGFTGKAYGFFKDTDNKIKPSVMDINFKEYVSKMNEWYKNGYIYQEAFATDGATAREIIKKGQVGSSAMWYSAITIQSPYIQPAANYVLCAPMEGPKGKIETAGGMSESAALVPAHSKKADLVIKYINWAHEDIENHIVAEDGIKDVNWKYTDEANHVIEPINENYIGEFLGHQGLGLETRYSFSDPVKKMHYDYIREDLTNLDRAVKGDTFDMLFNNAVIQTAVPNLEDIKRMTEEELTKFITGVRPLDQYETFLKELNGIGMDKYIDELTRQYNEAKGN